MKIMRDGREVRLGDTLEELFREADARHPGQTALHVVGLLDERGLALAAALHESLPGGPDPVELRDRAREMGAVEPLLAGATRLDVLTRALAALPGAAPPERALLAWTVRAVHRHGETPVVILTDGMALVATLDAIRAADGDELEMWGWDWTSPKIEA